jgi:hypothetical protein
MQSSVGPTFKEAMSHIKGKCVEAMKSKDALDKHVKTRRNKITKTRRTMGDKQVKPTLLQDVDRNQPKLPPSSKPIPKRQRKCHRSIKFTRESPPIDLILIIEEITLVKKLVHKRKQEACTAKCHPKKRYQIGPTRK